MIPKIDSTADAIFFKQSYFFCPTQIKKLDVVLKCTVHDASLSAEMNAGDQSNAFQISLTTIHSKKEHVFHIKLVQIN